MDYPLKIKSITINNFRRYKKLKLDFAEPESYSVLVGRNGTGKTSILEAINIAISEKSSKFTDIKETDFNCMDPIVFEVEFTHPFFFKFLDSNDGYHGLIPCYKYKKTIKRRDRKEAGQLFSSEYHVITNYILEEFNPDNTEFEALKDLIKDIKAANEHIVRELKTNEGGGFKYRNQSSNVGSYKEYIITETEANYVFEKFLFPATFYFDNNRGRELLPQYNTVFSNIVSELNWRYKRAFTKPANSTKKDTILQNFSSLHNEFKDLDSYGDELLQPAFEMLSNDLGVSIDEVPNLFVFNPYQPYADCTYGIMTSDEQFIPITKLGSGISILTALALSISFAKQAKTPAIILIDEPELHLHADLQKNLYSYLKSNGFQSIVSTHSHLFIDSETPNNNFIVSETLVYEYLEKMEAIDVSDMQFRILGHSLEDLYIPEKILIVEGKHDRNVLIKCLKLLGHTNVHIQIVPAGGKDKIPDKTDSYDVVINEVLSQNKWYSPYIKNIIKIIVDGDVTRGKVQGWADKFGLDKELQIKHLDPEQQFELEHLFPESLIKECVQYTTLADGTNLVDKTKKEIVDIILLDDKEKEQSKYLQNENRVSKSRLNNYINERLDAELLNSVECEDLKNIVDWLLGNDDTVPEIRTEDATESLPTF